jgi:hypothetical protein
MRKSVGASLGAGLEQVEKATVLEQQLLRPEGQRALGTGRVGAGVDCLGYRFFVRQGAAGNV